MSKFLETPEKAMTPMCFHKEATFYVLEEHRRSLMKFENYPDGSLKGKEEELIQRLLNIKGRKLRMYGSARELVENLKIYRNFPESHLYFNTDVDTYQVEPVIYKSLKNEKFILKSDLFVILQNMMIHLEEYSTIEIISIISFFLKSKEERVSKNMEFVRFDEKLLEDIEKELGEETGKNDLDDTLSKQLTAVMARLSFDECFKLVKNLCPSIWNDRKHIRVEELITTSCNDLSPEMRPVVFSIICKSVIKWIESLGNVIRKHPELFLPYCEIENNFMPPTVRMFEDGEGNQRFVMKSELSTALNRRLDSEDDTNSRFTMNMGDVLRNYGKERIEYIRFPIKRSKHRAVPVKAGGPNDFFILAVDAFFELMKDLIIGAQIFQNNDIGKFSLIFHELEKFFKPQCLEPYFIRVQTGEMMKRLMQTVTDEKMPVKNIRNAKPDGFTLQNLKNELKHLGLTDNFTEIEEHAEVVYTHVDQIKKGEFLRTCDLFDAVEICQLICVLNRIPNLKKFLHNQKGCGRIPGLKCDECEKDIQNSI